MQFNQSMYWLRNIQAIFTYLQLISVKLNQPFVPNLYVAKMSEGVKHFGHSKESDILVLKIPDISLSRNRRLVRSIL